MTYGGTRAGRRDAPFAAAIFDMDGLLIDSERTIMQAWIDVSRSLGVVLSPDDYGAVIGRSDRESEELLAALLGGIEVFRAAARQVGERLERRPEPRYPIKPGASDLLMTLRARGVRCAVASSSRHDEIRHRLAGVGVLERFDAVAGGDEVPRAKPDPAVYALAARRLGVDAARCLAFEDSENGALAALAAGLQVVLVPDLKAPRDDVRERSLCALRSLAEAIPQLPGWFDRG